MAGTRQPGQVRTLPVVGVLGSGSDPCEPQASGLGTWLAEIGVHLLTGGGRGVMESVSRGFCSVPERRGISIGVIPCRRHPVTENYQEPKKHYPNPFVELPIQTHLHLSGSNGTNELSRNHINILSSTVLVALPGGTGTSSEASLAIETYGKPLIAYLNDRSQIPGLPQSIRVESNFAEIKEFILAVLAETAEAECKPPGPVGSGV